MSRIPHSQPHHWNPAGLVRMQSAPIAPASAYEAWLAAAHPHHFRGSKVDGARLRRWVIMRRNGSDYSEIAKAFCSTAGTVSRWLQELPQELAP